MLLSDVNVNIVHRQTNPVVPNIVPTLEANLMMQCLMCGHIHMVGVPQVFIIKEDSQPSNIISTIKAVSMQTRSCDNCGILSVLPKADVKRLEVTLRRIITTEYIDEHCHDRPPVFTQCMFEHMRGYLATG